ncbi:Hypothetical predicted protein [Prunus dulcis]|uniref:Uncharacterized protein n=1 Tax=Prunus dulcis TaxID=3755 RepID=A0A5E4F8G6_PRUDU|nr:Hypothetical predicted protein [Prunus dulcis]
MATWRRVTHYIPTANSVLYRRLFFFVELMKLHADEYKILTAATLTLVSGSHAPNNHKPRFAAGRVAPTRPETLRPTLRH